MKKLCLLLLLFALLLCSCKQDVRVEESDGDGLQTYQLPTEWTVSRYGKTRTYAVSCEGGTATVTEDGKLLLRVTLDEAGNVVSRENADGARLEAVYDADGRLAETLLRDADGDLQQRTVYDRNGRAVREYTRDRHGEVSIREFTYGEAGELRTELQYSFCESYTYEYHANGELAAETAFLLDILPYYRREYREDGTLALKYDYDKNGNVSFRREYDEEGEIAAEYDADGNLYVNDREEKIYDGDGKLIEYKTYRDDGTLYEREEYDYDDNGNCVAQRTYYGESALSRERFMTYDGAGTLTKLVENSYRFAWGEDEGSELLDTTEIDYDGAGNPVQYTYYDGEGNVTSRSERTYEVIAGEWQITRITSYDGDGSLWFWNESVYDGKGNQTAGFSYDADGKLLSRIEYTYDDRDNPTGFTQYDEDGNVSNREVSVYDEQNNLQSYTSYNGDGSIYNQIVYENTYDYDDAGRPVKATRKMLGQRLTYACESGSSLRKETVTDENGDVVRSYETVCDNNGNPRIKQGTELGYERRYDYEWSPEGGLRACVWTDAHKEEVSRLAADNFVSCSLTETQYRRLLELLLAETDAVYTPRVFYEY